MLEKDGHHLADNIYLFIFSSILFEKITKMK